jgi:hypothetical protein
MAADLAGAGRFLRPGVFEIRAVPMRAKAQTKTARALPRIATTPATITEAEGFEDDIAENYIAFPGGRGQLNQGKKKRSAKGDRSGSFLEGRGSIGLLKLVLHAG